MSNIAKMQEIANRGLQDKLDPERRAVFDEALRRGLIDIENPRKPSEMPKTQQTTEVDVMANEYADDAFSSRLGSMAVDVVKNTPESAYNLLNNVGLALMHPIDTIQGLGEIAFGAAEKIIPGEQENEERFNQVAGFFKERYGSLEKLNETLRKDPVGVMADVSAALTGGAASVRGVGNLAKIPQLSKVGQAGVVTGQALNPVNVTRETATVIPRASITKDAATGLARGMVEKQLKPSTTLKPAVRKDIISYMLDNGINVTQGGLQKLEKAMRRNNQLIDDVIEGAAKRGESISVDSLKRNLVRTKRQFQDGLFAEDLMPHIDRAVDLLDNHKNNVGGRIAIDKARAMKTDLNRSLKGAYGELSTVTDEVLKDIVHGINKEIYKKYPELKQAGLDLRTQIALERELERAVNRLGNNNAISLQDIGLGGAAGASSASPELAVSAALVNKVLRMPSIKGFLARRIKGFKDKNFVERQGGVVPELIRDTAIAGEVTNN